MSKLEKYEIQTDCYAINEDFTDCKCLNKLYCKKEKCGFYKSNKDISWQAIERAVNSYGFTTNTKI